MKAVEVAEGLEGVGLSQAVADLVKQGEGAVIGLPRLGVLVVKAVEVAEGLEGVGLSQAVLQAARRVQRSLQTVRCPVGAAGKLEVIVEVRCSTCR